MRGINLLPLLACFGLISQGSLAAPRHKAVTCPYLNTALQFDVPAKFGDLPKIEFDYPVQATQFSLRDNNLLVVAMDESETTRLRIVISGQLNKAKSSYDGQILVDMGGNQMQLHNGPVSCKISNAPAHS